jgi:tryptophan synthase beta chain
MGLECKVYMGAVDVHRQALNVFRMRLLGAEVEPVDSGSRTLKDAVNEALRDWVASVESTHYCLGSVMGPAPVSRGWCASSTASSVTRRASSSPPSSAASRTSSSHASAVGRTRWGSSAASSTAAAASSASSRGGAAVGRGVPGVVHGMRSYLMQDEHGQVQEAQSISAGLDYPGVGPEHSYLASLGRAEYPAVTDAEVVAAFQLMARNEGIIPALESSHALAWIVREAHQLQGATVLMNLSGRGDKDVGQMMEILG